MNYLIDATAAGQTIKVYLTKTLGLSRRAICLLKYREDGITVNGEHRTVRYVLQEGDTLGLFYEDTDGTANTDPFDAPIDIVYEDGGLLCVNKPPFLPMHPSRGLSADTLAARVVAYMGNPFVFRVSTRLDRNTSGVAVISKDKLMAAKMAKLFSDRKVDKAYITILCGDLTQRSGNNGVIDYNIRRQNGSIITREATAPAEDEGENSPLGATAVTRYVVLDHNDAYSLVAAYPLTGRTHQLRVHFATAGYPILGDDLYGSSSYLIDRQALHALKLRFLHPESGKMLTLTAAPGEDFLTAIDRCGLRGERIAEVDFYA